MSVLSHNSYGKSRVRLTKVTRREERHELMEITVDIELEGDFEASYTEGDNRRIVATDTMKNTVYALARSHSLEHLEGFGLHLAAHFADGYPQLRSATIRLAQQPWERIAVGGAPHPTAFVGGGSEQRVCTVVRSGGRSHVEAGLEGLLVLKTTDSSFTGFERDALTTLPDTDDRILATSVTARWSYAPGAVDWNRCHAAARVAMLEVFATHHSLAVQQTLHVMGEAALAACPQITEITLQLPNRHRLLVNLQPFRLDNPNVIFVPTDEPYGMISGTLRRE
ncbi:MAG: urate oxidase [Gemmatimonadetes bacterium]|nr:urate oxidase [Gemmatimonadota bacterium]